MNRPKLVLLVLAFGASVAAAQGTTEVFRESQLDANRLIEALKPPAEEPLPPGQRSRSIKLLPSGGAPAARPAPRRQSAAVMITFETNSAALTDEARRSLDVVANALSSDQLGSFSFLIEGHADIRGNADDNLRLSEARAQSVRQYLIEVKRINPERLRAVGKGDREPINSRDIAAPENRRVAFVTVQQ